MEEEGQHSRCEVQSPMWEDIRLIVIALHV